MKLNINIYGFMEGHVHKLCAICQDLWNQMHEWMDLSFRTYLIDQLMQVMSQGQII